MQNAVRNCSNYITVVLTEQLVFARIGNETKVIGIVSKADGRAEQGLFWAVPITEVTALHSKGDTIEDTELFRR